MSRTLALRLAVLCLGAAMLVPAHAARAGSWSTWIKMVTVNDVLALRDTVLIGTGEAGIVRFLRLEDRFESITREPGGLASNTVTAMTFDRSGRLWAGTKGKGVSRLSADGKRWDLVNAFDGLPSDSVTVLRADGDTVWIGTTRGFALWNGHLIAGSVPDIGTASDFRSDYITGLVVRGDLLFAATHDGLYRAWLSQNVKNWTETDTGIPSLVIEGLATDGQNLFALSAGQVYAWNPADSTWALSSVPGVVSRIRDDNGTLLTLGTGGIFRWDGAQWSYVLGSPASSGPGDLTGELAADPDGKSFATQGASMFEQADPAWIVRQPPGPVENDVQNVLHDGTQLWVATYAGGVSRFDGTTWRGFPKGCCGLGQDTTFVNPDQAFTLQRDASGRIWFSNWGFAIERADPSTHPMHFDHVLLASSDSLARHTSGWSSALDSTGYLYIGGDTGSRGVIEPVGIDVFDPAANLVITWKTTNTLMGSNQVRAVAIDRSGTLWAGFAGGGVSWAPLDTVDSDRATPGNDHLRLPLFEAMPTLVGADVFGVVAHGDSIWVLTDSDLQRIRTSRRTVSSIYEIPGGPAPRGAVHPLDVAPDGTVWVGSIDGVRRYLPGGGSVNYRTDNSPLASDEVRSVYVERATGAVWFATASGVNRFDPHWQPPAPPEISRLSLRLWPNPATLTAMGVQLHLGANAPTVAGEVVDLGGRVVRRFSGIAAGGVAWDGRDADGTLVRPGVYFVHARGGGREAMVRVVVLR